MNQKDIFIKQEGNSWYERNKHGYIHKKIQDDLVFKALQQVNFNPKRILEIGCANGWRVSALSKHYNATGYGIDPSLAAIKDGLKIYQNVQLTQGTADNFPTIEPVDLIIFGFCLYLCEPNDLFKIASRCHELLQDRGVVAIVDFHPPHGYYRNKYIHQNNVYSYKMNYSHMLCWHPAYHRIFELVQHHDKHSEFMLDSLVSVQIIKKNEQLLIANNPYEL
ncbi:class I SAM-dependent methyltransferase [Aeromonas hydrophila]|uniref:class I SAM-dependent methyltransferase n=1 Tax=Aeromonas hydrophila TaxID=644 RepID=UPI00111A02A4|nr:class I SAM-dependent methyltransferase [Aeromonas hydrophila]MCX4104474.1 class I SAM-dependent methyltransferase [Aeromonas hydrophila]TNJ24057.1 methyltransferase type 11 [Aeromonas hydrophila]HDX8451339.1 class I SAM-dependent methyltransferase [Aeromonas hydrophila]